MDTKNIFGFIRVKQTKELHLSIFKYILWGRREFALDS